MYVEIANPKRLEPWGRDEITATTPVNRTPSITTGVHADALEREAGFAAEVQRSRQSIDAMWNKKYPTIWHGIDRGLPLGGIAGGDGEKVVEVIV